jgi:hypothetical protein
MPDETKKFYGKYRGTVMNNVDPMQMGRIQAIVPDVLGPIPTSFAMPCLPITGKQMGTFMLPQIGSGVWIEFEQGNPDYPIWTGGYWGIAAELPLAALAGNPAAPSLIFQSTLQNAVMISDLPPTRDAARADDRRNHSAQHNGRFDRCQRRGNFYLEWQGRSHLDDGPDHSRE